MFTSGFRWFTSFIERHWFPSPSLSPSATNPPEPQKPATTTGLWAIWAWHRWTVISIAGSVTLLYLNFTQYAIGGELGVDSVQTANILGALQLAIKGHELAIVASLVFIAKQWIHDSLLDLNKGVVLGLVGAEGSLNAPSFLISKEFLAAIRYGFTGGCSWDRRKSEVTARKREMVLLGGFLFIGCIVASLAGPASGVLMIPRVQWFFDKELILPIPNYILPYHGIHFPNMFIDPQIAVGQYTFGFTGDPFTTHSFHRVTQPLEYWSLYGQQRIRHLTIQKERTTHTMTDRYGKVALNTSTTWGRPLGGNWTGQTNISAIMRTSGWWRIVAMNIQRRVVDDYETAIRRWSGRKFVSYSGALVVRAECHFVRIKPCLPENHPEWCYTGYNNDTLLKSSHNLLLIGQSRSPGPYQLDIYMTEGPKSEKYPNFVTAMELVMFEWSNNISALNSTNGEVPAPGIVECTLSTVIRSAVTNSEIDMSSEYADYFDYQVLVNGTKEASAPLLFHEHWLDSVSAMSANNTLPPAIRIAPALVDLSPRNQSILTINPTLQQLANVMLGPYQYESLFHARGKMWPEVEAAEVELPLGGAFASILMYLDTSLSQYTLAPGLTLPDTFIPKAHFYQVPTTIRLEVYNLGYGFRLSSRSGKVGVAVLLLHAVIALVGSLWQLRRWRVVTAWGTIPEYLALGLASPSNQPGLENTSVSITVQGTLQSVVRIKEQVSTQFEASVVKLSTEKSGKSEVDMSECGSAIGAVALITPALLRVETTVE